MSGVADMQRTKRRRLGLLTHGLVALAAIVAAYFFLFYGYPYLFHPSLRMGRGCSPVAVTLVGPAGNKKRLRIEQNSCVPGWSDIAVSLQDESGTASHPFLVGGGKGAELHAFWTSANSATLKLTGKYLSIDYARDRVRGVRMDYSMRETPASATSD